MRTSPPRVVTLAVALVLWLIGLLDLVAKLDLPQHAGYWCALLAGALLLVASQVKGL